MKPAVLITVLVILFAAGIGGGYFILTGSDNGEPAIDTLGEQGVQIVDGASPDHGKRIIVPENAKICAKHKIPEVACPFCTPALIELLGYCRGHDVAEALCSRCNPSLIVAFKAEDDWCEDHGLPESQCRVCNPAEG